MPFSNVSKSSSPTFKTLFKHGKEPVMSELENVVFTDVYFEDGTTVENVRFNQLENQSWTNTSKS